MVQRKRTSSESNASSSCDDKRARLAFLGKAAYASQSAITFLLADIREQGLPDAISRKSQYRVREDACRREITHYGPMINERTVRLANAKEYRIGFALFVVFVFVST